MTAFCKFMLFCYCECGDMRNYSNRLILLLAIIIAAYGCHAQPQLPALQQSKTDREPAVAGSFYPADRTELLKMVTDLLDAAPVVLHKQPLAVVAPHAGYIFSGSIAAASFKQIDRNRAFSHIFIIGSSHTTYFEGASVFTDGNYVTPLGTVKVDTLAEWLHRNYSFINNSTSPHLKEHAIEVELPFLQVWLKKPFSIVPIIIGGESEVTCRKLAAALAPFFTPDNLFVISTDFSHYPSYWDARYSDSLMAQAVLSNSPKKFIETKKRVESSGIPDLVTTMCGWTSLLTLMDITDQRPDIYFEMILSANSGDTRYGEKDRVVGYCALAAVQQNDAPDPSDEPPFRLTDHDKAQLLKIARSTLEDYIRERNIHKVDERMLTENLMTKAGAFVTLRLNGSLRGCVGSFGEDQPLYLTVQSMAIAAASQDYRFTPVSKSEIPDLKIEISVLTPRKKISSIDEIKMGRDGIYLKKGNRSGTFLPQVAEETNWTREEFLGHCARDKAFIGWDGWKDADIYIYQALVFDESEFAGKLKQGK